jgi:hypothetical protein
VPFSAFFGDTINFSLIFCFAFLPFFGCFEAICVQNGAVKGITAFINVSWI